MPLSSHPNKTSVIKQADKYHSSISYATQSVYIDVKGIPLIALIQQKNKKEEKVRKKIL